jgi:hypothetical protein
MFHHGATRFKIVTLPLSSWGNPFQDNQDSNPNPHSVRTSNPPHETSPAINKGGATNLYAGHNLQPADRCFSRDDISGAELVTSRNRITQQSSSDSQQTGLNY